MLLAVLNIIIILVLFILWTMLKCASLADDEINNKYYDTKN